LRVERGKGWNLSPCVAGTLAEQDGNVYCMFMVCAEIADTFVSGPAPTGKFSNGVPAGHVPRAQGCLAEAARTNRGDGADKRMLTQKQKDLLLFIHGRMQESGVPPSFDEMKEALDLKSKSGIHRLITALVERGFIRRLPHRARAIEVLKLPEDLGGGASGANARAVGDGTRPAGMSEPDRGFVPQMIEGGLGKAGADMREGAGGRETAAGQGGNVSMSLSEETAGLSVPLMGRIAAGTPISAIQDHQNDVICPPDMLSGGEHFALEVHGDSMIEAGIHDGDTVIIKRCQSASNGDIVVALVEKEEATLKRLRKKGSTVALEAANPAYETRIFGPDQVEVQGRLVGLIRRY